MALAQIAPPVLPAIPYNVRRAGGVGLYRWRGLPANKSHWLELSHSARPPLAPSRGLALDLYPESAPEHSRLWHRMAFRTVVTVHQIRSWDFPAEFSFLPAVARIDFQSA